MAMLKQFRKQLRMNPTDVETLLWNRLRNRQLAGCKFRRQHIVDGYIVDFVCLERKLIVELDGGQHDQQRGYDARRTYQLRQSGFQVVRFWNNEVLENLTGVLTMIQHVLMPEVL